MSNLGEQARDILDELHTERLSYESEYVPLAEAANLLIAYEETGLAPEDILSATDMAKVACALHELNQYKDLGSIDRLREAVEKQSEYDQFMERWKQVAEIAGAVKQFGAERVAELVEADRDGRCVIVTRCCECKNHSDVYGEHYCKFWRMYCPNDSEFYCKAAKPLKGEFNGTT